MKNNLALTYGYIDHGSDDTSLSASDWTTAVDSSTMDAWDTLTAGELPGGYVIFINKLNEILNLPEDWDSYGAPRIKRDCVIKAMILVDNIISENIPMPSVVPTHSGGVQLEWHTGGIDLEIKIESLGKVGVYFDDETDPDLEWEGEISYDFNRLLKFMNTLSNRYQG